MMDFQWAKWAQTVGPSDDAEFQEWLQAAVKRNLEPLKESAMFLALFTMDFERDALPVLQFGLAVLLDKPIYLLAPKDRPIPDNVRRLAHAIAEYAGPADVESATQRLLHQAEQRGHVSPRQTPERG